LPDKYSLEPLAWDTDFLGFPVAKITIGPAADLSLVADAVEHAPFRLIYCFADEAFFTADQVLSAVRHAVRVDGKTRYITGQPVRQPSAENLGMADKISPRLVALAKQAGRYSRFFTDKHFKEGTCERMYQAWIEKSVSGEIADRVFQFTNAHREQLGFLTVAEKNSWLDLGLLCVNEKARGLGIATALLQHAENYALSRQCQGMQLVTQEQNTPARSLFEKYGFKQESVTGIFHVWK
jgi:dTDP-4-amino-4,6-dideoxy-D-galactose acyltransferase